MTRSDFESAVRRRWGAEAQVQIFEPGRQIIVSRQADAGVEVVVGKTPDEVLAKGFPEEREPLYVPERAGEMPGNLSKVVGDAAAAGLEAGRELAREAPDLRMIDSAIETAVQAFRGSALRGAEEEAEKKIGPPRTP